MPHPLKGGCGIGQTAQNFVGHLFRKTHRQFAAELFHDGGCAGNEIEQVPLNVLLVKNNAIDLRQSF